MGLVRRCRAASCRAEPEAGGLWPPGPPVRSCVAPGVARGGNPIPSLGPRGKLRSGRLACRLAFGALASSAYGRAYFFARAPSRPSLPPRAAAASGLRSLAAGRVGPGPLAVYRLRSKSLDARAGSLAPSGGSFARRPRTLVPGLPQSLRNPEGA